MDWPSSVFPNGLFCNLCRPIVDPDDGSRACVQCVDLLACLQFNQIKGIRYLLLCQRQVVCLRLVTRHSIAEADARPCIAHRTSNGMMHVRLCCLYKYIGHCLHSVFSHKSLFDSIIFFVFTSPHPTKQISNDCQLHCFPYRLMQTDLPIFGFSI